MAVAEKKKGPVDEFVNFIELAFKTRKGFTPETLKEFETAGQKSYAARLIPSKTEQIKLAGTEFKPEAVKAAVALGDAFELAAQGEKKLNFKEWVG